MQRIWSDESEQKRHRQLKLGEMMNRFQHVRNIRTGVFSALRPICKSHIYIHCVRIEFLNAETGATIKQGRNLNKFKTGAYCAHPQRQFEAIPLKFCQ